MLKYPILFTLSNLNFELNLPDQTKNICALIQSGSVLPHPVLLLGAHHKINILPIQFHMAIIDTLAHIQTEFETFSGVYQHSGDTPKCWETYKSWSTPARIIPCCRFIQCDSFITNYLTSTDPLNYHKVLSPPKIRSTDTQS